MNFKDFLLLEYVVPMGFNLDDWISFRKKHEISNKDYHLKHRDKKWKVVHGHTDSKGKRGDALPGLNNISYEKATKAHSAIEISKN